MSLWFAASRFLDETRDTLLNPSFIVEVLSPSTEFYDRRKFEQYTSLESVSEYPPGVFRTREGRVVHPPAQRPLAAHYREPPGRRSICNLSGRTRLPICTKSISPRKASAPGSLTPPFTIAINTTATCSA